MTKLCKRFVALVLVLAMVSVMIPTIAAEPAELTEADYAAQEALFAQIEQLEDVHAKRGSSQKTVSEAAEALVLASENYVEGSLERNGDAFTWMTEEGIRCGYNPRMRRIREEMVAPEEPEQTGIVNEPVANRGGSPSSKQVYLIGPYYNSDDSFTDQYKNEAKAIAQAIGDTDGYTLYADSAASITNVAKAISNGAVVIFDSHGTTDYERSTGRYDDWGDPVYDYVSGATNSYLCLSTKSGLTTADYNDGAVWDGYDAFVNGAAIANHMTTNSPSGFLWMAICLGMATDTICQPMRDMGVEVVYGYSQSVTFAGDYCFEETFWNEMRSGSTVAEAVATMKQRFGNWDWSTQIASYYGYSDGYTSISEARKDYLAFPVVVSDEDAHPGQRNDLKSNTWGACSLQTVKSTYTLFAEGETPSTPDTPDIPTEPEVSVVTSPTVGTAYKLGMDRGEGEVWYFNGYTESASVSYRLDSTTDIDEAVDVYLEQAGSGYRMYFMNGSAKTYIRVFHYQDGSAGKGKGSLALTTSKPSEYYVYDTAADTLIYNYDSSNAYYMGCYSSYTAFSVSNTSYITGSNASNVDISQFPARLYQEKVAHTHSYENGEDTTCDSCGYTRTAQGIAIHQLPAQQEIPFMTGSLDTTGGSLQVTYSDGSTGIVEMKPEMVTGFDNRVLGQQTLTVTYAGYTATYTVTVVAETPNAMAILSLPEKLSYLTGEQIDLTGLSLLAIYGDVEQEIAATNVTLDAVDMSTAGVKTVIVRYYDAAIAFEIYVHEMQAVTIDSSLYPESEHNYPDNANEIKTFTYPGADSLVLTFSSQSYTEAGYDYIEILDGAGSRIGLFNGSIGGKTVTVPGDIVQIKLTSDTSVNKYGYAFSSILAETILHPGDLCCEICGESKMVAGQTTVLTNDLVLEELTIPTGATVDLNGHILLADTVVSFGQIVDSAGDGELWATNLEMSDNAWLPIQYEPACYRFFEYEIESLGSKAAGENVRFGFSLNFRDAQAYDLLAEAADTQITVTLAVGESAQAFAFSKELIEQYVLLQSKYPQLRPSLQLNVTGMDAVQTGTEITVTPAVSAVAGQVLKTGAEMTYIV